MSSNFTGVTFTEQRVTPADDAQVRRAILPDGILSGCELSYSGSTLTMAAGSLIACGRQFRHPAAQNWAVVDASSGYARLLLTIDLTKTATIDAFEQIVDTIEYATSADGFPELIQDDINSAGTKYQVVVCVVSLGSGGITGIVSQLKQACAVSDEVLTSNGDQTMSGNLDVKPADLTKFKGFRAFRKISADAVETYMAQFGMTPTPGAAVYFYKDSGDGKGNVIQNQLTLAGTYTSLRQPLNIASGGTEAKTAAEALANLGGVSITKLWENASPTSGFAAQTISLDLSGYDGVMISAIFQSNSELVSTTGFVAVGDMGYLWVGIAGAARARKFTVSATGVAFELGAQIIDASATGRSEAAIPTVIYGIKGVSA